MVSCGWQALTVVIQAKGYGHRASLRRQNDISRRKYGNGSDCDKDLVGCHGVLLRSVSNEAVLVAALNELIGLGLRIGYSFLK